MNTPFSLCNFSVKDGLGVKWYERVETKEVTMNVVKEYANHSSELIKFSQI